MARRVGGLRDRMGGMRIGAGGRRLDGWLVDRMDAARLDGWHGIRAGGPNLVAQGLGLTSFLSRRDFVRVLVTVTAVVTVSSLSVLSIFKEAMANSGFYAGLNKFPVLAT